MTTRFTSLEAAADAAGVYHARWAGNSAHDLMLHVYQSNPDDFPDDKADWLADLAGDLAEALVNNEERLGVDKGALNRDLVFIAPVVAGDEVELQLASQFVTGWYNNGVREVVYQLATKSMENLAAGPARI